MVGRELFRASGPPITGPPQHPKESPAHDFRTDPRPRFPGHPSPPRPRRRRAADLYTRADAITDHLLIEVPRALVELYRLPWPLALTSTAWADAIAWPPAAHTPAARAARPGTPQRRESVQGSLADVLFLVQTTHESAQPGQAVHPFTVWRVPATAPTGRVRPLPLTLTINPGDHAEPVATLAHSPHRARWWHRHPLTLAAMTAALMFAPALALLRITH